MSKSNWLAYAHICEQYARAASMQQYGCGPDLRRAPLDAQHHGVATGSKGIST